MTFTHAEQFAVLVLIQMFLVGTIIYLVARYRRAWGAGYEAGTIDAGPGAGYATTVAVIPELPPVPVLELPAGDVWDTRIESSGFLPVVTGPPAAVIPAGGPDPWHTETVCREMDLDCAAFRAGLTAQVEQTRREMGLPL